MSGGRGLISDSGEGPRLKTFFFLSTLYNFQNIGGREGHVLPGPGPHLPHGPCESSKRKADR